MFLPGEIVISQTLQPSGAPGHPPSSSLPILSIQLLGLGLGVGGGEGAGLCSLDSFYKGTLFLFLGYTQCSSGTTHGLVLGGCSGIA